MIKKKRMIMKWKYSIMIIKGKEHMKNKWKKSMICKFRVLLKDKVNCRSRK